VARLLVVDSKDSRPWLVGELRRRGHRVTLLTVDGTDVRSCPEHHVIRIADFSAEASEAAGEVVAESRPHGIVCWESFSVPTASRIATRLALPSPWDPSGLDLSDKWNIYQLWLAAGLPVPHTWLVDGEGPPQVLPTVVKPSSFGGAIGVRLCRDACEYRAALEPLGALIACRDDPLTRTARSYGLSCRVIAQRVVRPDSFSDWSAPEFSAEFVVQDGQPTLFGFTVKGHMESQWFPEHYLLAPLPPVLAAIIDGQRDVLASYIRAVGMGWGFAHLEFAIEDGIVQPFELNPRLIGDRTARTVADAYRVDLPELIVACATGNRSRVNLAGGAGAFHATIKVQVPVQTRTALLASLDLRVGDDRSGVEADPALEVAVGGVLRPDLLRGSRRVARVLARGPDVRGVRSVIDSFADPDRIQLVPFSMVEWRRARPCLRPAGFGSELLDLTGDTHSSSAWMRAVEGMPGAAWSATLTVETVDDIVAAVPVWTTDRHLSRSHRPPGVDEDLLESECVLLVGSRSGYTASWLCHPSLDDSARRVIDAVLVRAVVDLAASRGCAQAWIPYADRQLRDRLDMLGAVVNMAPAKAVACLDLTGMTYREWIQGSPTKVRQRLEAERRRIGNSSMRVRPADLGDCLDVTADLLSRQQIAKGRAMSLDSARSYLATIASAFGNRATVLQLRDEGRSVAFTLVLRAGNSVDVRVYGARDVPDEEIPWFRLIFHEVPRFAVPSGYARITMGPSAEQAKRNHGAKMDGRWWLGLDLTRR
jgi:hypothetical protein